MLVYIRERNIKSCFIQCVMLFTLLAWQLAEKNLIIIKAHLAVHIIRRDFALAGVFTYFSVSCAFDAIYFFFLASWEYKQ